MKNKREVHAAKMCQYIQIGFLSCRNQATAVFIRARNASSMFII